MVLKVLLTCRVLFRRSADSTLPVAAQTSFFFWGGFTPELNCHVALMSSFCQGALDQIKAMLPTVLNLGEEAALRVTLTLTAYLTGLKTDRRVLLLLLMLMCSG